MERCILASTNEGDLVLDPFLGGGTTAVQATARFAAGERSGSATLVRFSRGDLPGGGAGPDSTPFEKVYVVLEGQMTVIIGG